MAYTMITTIIVNSHSLYNTREW